ncbi:MAG: ATP-binding protein [Muribaculaceae bacterium]|nr:ATP-binding protein [Muribaculaceae bacterium]
MLPINRSRWGKFAFFIAAIAVVALFLRISSRIVGELSEQERERMELWADATRRLADPEAAGDDIDFLLSVIQGNTTIPVLVADDAGNIIDHRNFNLPDPANPESEENRNFLQARLHRLANGNNVIVIAVAPEVVQYLYYEDSKLLRKLSYFPYLQLVVMIVFILVVYYAVSSSKRAEQNKVWVGLSKETAHQLGTPISSLMAWTEMLATLDVDPDIVKEIDKDVNRLSTIASRFSKIGSKPALETENLNEVVARAASYMATRISSRIKLTVNLCPRPLPVALSAPLIEWVMENLIKNAVDAMEGSGSITITSSAHNNEARIELSDTGKGISRKLQKTIFKPGFTTKKRGWGLGLTLAKRIVDDYHRGHIFVSRSEPGVGTTFCLTFPLTEY